MTYSIEELEQIENQFAHLEKALKAQSDKLDLSYVHKSIETAKSIYADFELVSDRKFIFQPLEIAMICVAEMGLGAATAISILLIDAVNRNKLNLHSVASNYGTTVHSIMEGILKVDKIDISHVFEEKETQEIENEELDEFEEQERKKQQKRATRRNRIKVDKVSEQADTYINMLSSIAVDVRVSLIKLAVQLHRIRNYKHLPIEKQEALARETSYIYTPMAHKLGLYKIKTDFEEITMKILERKMFDFIEKKLKETKDARDEFIKAFMLPFAEDLANRGFVCEVK